MTRRSTIVSLVWTIDSFLQDYGPDGIVEGKIVLNSVGATNTFGTVADAGINTGSTNTFLNFGLRGHAWTAVDNFRVDAPIRGYASWIAGFPEIGDLTGFNEDADRDGLSNGVENGLGSHPGQSSTGLRTVTTAGNSFTFSHDQSRPPARAVDLSYQWSTNLTAWYANAETSPGGTLVNISSEVTGVAPVAGVDEVLVTALASGAPSGRLYLRTRATLSAP